METLQLNTEASQSLVSRVACSVPPNPLLQAAGCRLHATRSSCNSLVLNVHIMRCFDLLEANTSHSRLFFCVCLSFFTVLTSAHRLEKPWNSLRTEHGAVPSQKTVMGGCGWVDLPTHPPSAATSFTPHHLSLTQLLPPHLGLI